VLHQAVDERLRDHRPRTRADVLARQRVEDRVVEGRLELSRAAAERVDPDRHARDEAGHRQPGLRIGGLVVVFVERRLGGVLMDDPGRA
jgi:hypothetical protein